MKSIFRRVLLLTAVLYLILGLSPLVFRAAVSKSGEAAESGVSSGAGGSSAPDAAETGVFRILDTGTGEILTVSDAEFLRGALPCELSLDAPDEALKAQLVAIYTVYSRKRLQNADAAYDFTCDSANRQIYMTDSDLSALFGDRWDSTEERLDTLCEAVAGRCLLYDGEPIESTYFAISAGCTQPFENVWSEKSYPYLTAVACPFDMLYDGYKATASFSPEEVRAAFPDITFTDTPETWFSDAHYYESGYVESISLCGTVFSGVDVRTALGLRSASFTVTCDGEAFTFTTLGWGHGVGMSQAGAIYMAENGADYREILAYFYPGAELA
ncbi:MAG: SpoIID/LytB domain-containing protein [Hominenteromicrobium sp.]